MHKKFSWLLLIFAATCLVFSACKSKRGAASANVRTLSVKQAKSYYLSFAGKSPEDSLITAKELAAVKNIKIMADGKEAKNIGLKFTCTIIKTSGESVQLQNDGTEISSEIKDQLKSLQSGDKFTFENIRITTPEGQETSYPSKEFQVK